LAEADGVSIPLVVTSDNHLLDIDADVLRDARTEADLNPAFPVNPRPLLRALR